MEKINKPIEEMDDKEFQELIQSYIDNLEEIRKTSISDFFKPY